MKILVLLIVSLIHRGHAPQSVVNAIVDVANSEEQAAIMTVYAALESDYQENKVGDNGKSCGVWQTPCQFTRTHSVHEQAAWWLYAVQHSSLESVDSNAKRAGERRALAIRLLEEARRKVQSNGQ